MNSQAAKAATTLFLIVFLLLVTSCGTSEISTEPEESAIATTAAGGQSQATTAAADEGVESPAPTRDTLASSDETRAAVTVSPENNMDAEGAGTASPTAAQSEITDIDGTWLRYTNHELGFSIDYPRSMINFLGSCKWNEENGDHSYRPDPTLVPAKIFEDGDTVYIGSEYFYVLGGETRGTSAEESGRSFFSECSRVDNSLELLRNPDHYQQMWEIETRDIHSDEELEQFLKDRYGPSCSLGEKVPSPQQGVYDVKILGDGKDLETTECPLNFGTVVKYYPDGGKVVAWNIGQAVTFTPDISNSKAYDPIMVESFRFLTGE